MRCGSASTVRLSTFCILGVCGGVGMTGRKSAEFFFFFFFLDWEWEWIWVGDLLSCAVWFSFVI